MAGKESQVVTQAQSSSYARCASGVAFASALAVGHLARPHVGCRLERGAGGLTARIDLTPRFVGLR
jgi:hypothetical protein